jgi:hypothetical protein
MSQYSDKNQAWTGRSTLQPARRPALQFHDSRVGESWWWTIEIPREGPHLLALTLSRRSTMRAFVGNMDPDRGDKFSPAALSRAGIACLREASKARWRNTGRGNSSGTIRSGIAPRLAHTAAPLGYPTRGVCLSRFCPLFSTLWADPPGGRRRPGPGGGR